MVQESQAIDYLRHWVLPEIRERHERALVRRLETAVDSQSLEPLGTLAVHEKTAFLHALEHFLHGPSRSRPAPSVAVKLTASLDLSPQVFLEAERRRAILPPR